MADFRPPLGCEVHVQVDAPSSADDFGAHTLCAETVYAILESAPKGVAVGLVGPWGSGKSTVVQLLRNRLAANAWDAVVLFDAWAHEGDPLRRSFLERIVMQFAEKRWINQEVWNHELSRLSGRERSSSIKSYPILTIGGWLYLASLLLVPLGAVLFANRLRAGSTFEALSSSIDWWAVVELVLMVGPLMVVGVQLVRYWTSKARRNMASDEKRKYLGELLAPFTQKGVTSTDTTTKEDGDATSLEFEQLYHRLLAEGLSSPERRLLIVLDNLDRVDRDTAQRVWAALQAFLAPSQSATTMGKCSLLVPYDRDALKRIWAADGTVPPAPAGREDIPTPGGQAEQGPSRQGSDEKNLGANGGLPNSYIDKAIQVVVEVPRSVQSNWRTYLVTALSRVFPAHNKLDFHPIYRLYDAFAAESARLPTPRDIKLFANELAAVHLRWGHEVGLIHQAHYVLISRFRGDVAKWMRAGANVTVREKALLPPDWLQMLAAIAFAIPPIEAMEVLAGPDIRRMLESGDGDALRTMGAMSPGMLFVLEGAIADLDSEWVGSEAFLFALAAQAVYQSGICIDGDPSAVQSIIATLARRMPGKEAIQVWTADTAETFAWLLGRREAMPHRDALLRAVRDLIGESYGTEREAVGFEAVAVLARAIVSPAGDQTRSPERLELTGPIDKVVGSLAGLAAEAPTLLDAVLPEHGWGPVGSFLASMAEAGEWNEGTTALVAGLLVIGAAVEWQKLADACVTGLTAKPEMGMDAVVGILSVLDVLDDGKAARPDFEQAVRGGALLDQLSRAHAQKVAAAELGLIRRIFLVAPELTNLGPQGADHPGYRALDEVAAGAGDVVASLAQQLYDRGESGMVFDGAASQRGRDLGIALAAWLLDNNKAGELFEPEHIIEHWDLLTKASSDVPLTQRHLPFDALAAALVRMEWQPTLWVIVHVVRESCSQDARERLEAWALDGLGHVPEATWLSQIKGGGDDLDILEVLLGIDRTRSKGVPHFRDALLEVGKEQVMGAVDRTVPEKVLKLLDLCAPEMREFVRRSILDAVYVAGSGTADAFIDAFGKELQAESQGIRGGDLFRRCLVPLSKVRNGAALRWIQSMVDDPSTPLGHGPAGELEALADALGDWSRDEAANVEQRGDATAAGQAIRTLSLNARPAKRDGRPARDDRRVR